MSYIASYVHCVFSTKERQKIITPELQERLWPFIGGIARANKMKAIEIGGVEDHVHALLSLPSTMAVFKSRAIDQRRIFKMDSREFSRSPFVLVAEGIWRLQRVSQSDHVVDYIRNQPSHHRTMTFQEEFLELLRKHRVEFDERYV